MQDILLFVNHHLMLIAALAVIVVLLIMVEGVKLKRGATSLSPARLTHLINHAKAIVIDIRTPDAFLTGHVMGAISLPAAELKTGLKKIEKFKAQPIVITCATGTDSPAAATFLTAQGFQVHVLNGGIRAWREADLPLVKK